MSESNAGLTPSSLLLECLFFLGGSFRSTSSCHLLLNLKERNEKKNRGLAKEEAPKTKCLWKAGNLLGLLLLIVLKHFKEPASLQSHWRLFNDRKSLILATGKISASFLDDTMLLLIYLNRLCKNNKEYLKLIRFDNNISLVLRLGEGDRSR